MPTRTALTVASAGRFLPSYRLPAHAARVTAGYRQMSAPTPVTLDVLQASLQTDSVRAFWPKPLAAGLDGAEQVVSLARARNVRVGNHHSRRYALSHQKLREQLPVRLGTFSQSMVLHQGLLHNTGWICCMTVRPAAAAGMLSGAVSFEGTS